MTFYIMDNFLGEKECEQLLKDASELPDENYIKSHEKKRKVLASTSSEFKKLIASSDIWQKLDKKINSKDFFDNIKKKLSISKSFYLTSFFSNYSTSSKNHLSFKNLGLYQLRNVNLVSLIKYIIYKSSRSFYRIIKFNLMNSIKAQPVELLYDYSKAVGGYKNRVHRDTDSRILIVLIYLNSLEENSKGGSLKIYKNQTGTTNYYPQNSDIKLIEDIKPKAGTLVAMINNNDLFHSVDEFIEGDLKKKRHFIYGGYTILSGKNPFLKKTKMKYKTAYHLYD